MNKDNNEKLGRRRLVVKLGAVGAVTLGAAACVPVQPVYVRPSGTGLTDADPNDGPGNGRGGAEHQGHLRDGFSQPFHEFAQILGHGGHLGLPGQGFNPFSRQCWP